MAKGSKKSASKRSSGKAPADEQADEVTPSAAELDATPAPSVEDETVPIWDEETPAHGTARPASTPPIPASKAKAEHAALRERRDRSRRRRLERVGVTADRCPVLDVELDVPLDRGAPGASDVVPTVHGDLVISRLAHQIVRTGATPEQLEQAAAWLRARGER